MDFEFENLGPDRFQEFCQCLINNEFPDSQSFPIGQRDGGRDSVAYEFDLNQQSFSVFQIKYVRDPNKIKDPHKWLVSIIEEEIQKIKNLIPKGARKYYLLTNVKATGYFEKGSIDKVHEILKTNISIPAVCWWRDDLGRKLESNISLKWNFPELMNGQDLLNSVVFSQLVSYKTKRETVIKAYLIDQYEIESEVKFKQIELQNSLIELFVDVPIRLKEYKLPKGEINKSLAEMVNSFKNSRQYKEEYEEDVFTSAADFILNKAQKFNLNRILLEGGPGQGKSTITQYVAQVHRIRLLNKQEVIHIPHDLKNSSLQLPFKIDLRDLASWLNKKNPYSSVINEDYFLRKWQKSLESFLVAHIFFHSKIEDFDVLDFIEICKVSSVLIVFDGFDEIADLKIRDEVIDHINKGINRIQENSATLRIIITSRPAAFATSKRFSSEVFPHFELADINAVITNQYVEKWVHSRKLKEREASEIRRIVIEKLKFPHLRSLAKSPMQLAILLSLINTRGESLPNKRTALYESYIELFFDREAEKHSTIRDKRELIISIHEYLAWVLHSEAELYNNNGRIEFKKLIEKLKIFLDKEGHPTEIADELFTVMRERVCALASRVQGTFEFEVQPLREFFCAKYLYNTSPYSPAGKEKKGTKPDRFDAMVRNYYWQNVLRFFAGCFDRGELPMLISKLRELEGDPYFQFTNYPRYITSQLLSDWVFSQYPKLLSDVLSIILNGINVGIILNQFHLNYRSETIILPKGSGREDISKECFKVLKKLPSMDHAIEIIGLINNNPDNVVDEWSAHAEKLSKDDLTMWLNYGLYLRIYHKIEREDILKLFFSDDQFPELRIIILLNVGRADVINSNFKIKEICFNYLLNTSVFIYDLDIINHLNVFGGLFNLRRILSFVQDVNLNSERPFIHFITELYINHNYKQKVDLNLNELKSTDKIDVLISDFFQSSKEDLNLPTSQWKGSLMLWDRLIENARSTFGDKKLFYKIAIIISSIKSSVEKYPEYTNLSDSTVSLCKRVRHARLKSGVISYWDEQFKKHDTSDLTLITFLTWATAKTITHFLDLIVQKIKQLSKVDQEVLIESLQQLASLAPFPKAQQESLVDILKNKKVPDLLKYGISLRFSKPNTFESFNLFLYEYEGNNKEILSHKFEMLKKKLKIEQSKKAINDIMSLYKKLNTKYKLFRYGSQIYYDSRHIKLEYDLAKYVMENCKNLPKYLVFSAEVTCREIANSHLIPVGRIAEKDQWFVDEP